MTEEKIEEDKKDVLEMLTRRLIGVQPNKLETAQRDQYLWECFIQQIKEGLHYL